MTTVRESVRASAKEMSATEIMAVAQEAMDYEDWEVAAYYLEAHADGLLATAKDVRLLSAQAMEHHTSTGN